MIHEQQTRGGPRTWLLEGRENIFFCDTFGRTSTLERLFLEMRERFYGKWIWIRDVDV